MRYSAVPAVVSGVVGRHCLWNGGMVLVYDVDIGDTGLVTSLGGANMREEDHE